MLDGKGLLIALLAGGIIYGGAKAAHGIKVLAVDTAKIVSHPFRHPKKDAKAVVHAVTHPALLKH